MVSRIDFLADWGAFERVVDRKHQHCGAGKKAEKRPLLAVFLGQQLTGFLYSYYRSNGFEIRPRSIPNDEDGGRGEMSRQWHLKLDAWGS